MRVLIIVEQFPAITETFIVSKVKSLLKNENEVIILCNKRNDDLLTQFFSNSRQPTIKIFSNYTILINVFSFEFLRRIGSVQNFKLVKSLLYSVRINKLKADIVHFEFSAIGLKYVPFLHLFKSKIVVSCRGTAEKVKLPFSLERQDLFRRLTKKAAKIHCVSADMANTIRPYCKKEKKIAVIWPSVDTAYFFNKRKQDKDFNTILSIGRLVFAKGFSFGLYTMSILKRKGINFKWIIVGDGEKREELTFKINCFNLQSEVILESFKSKEEIRKLMAAATVFYLPSVYEGIANVVLEAMSMELPVVTTDCGGMPEIIQDGFNGFVCRQFDFQSQSSAILKLLIDKDLRTRIGKNARSSVHTYHSIDDQIAQFESLYAEIIG